MLGAAVAGCFRDWFRRRKQVGIFFSLASAVHVERKSFGTVVNIFGISFAGVRRFVEHGSTQSDFGGILKL